MRFYDTDGERWVTWEPGVDAPPLPPGWARSGGQRRATARVAQPVAADAARARRGGRVVIAVVQALRPSGSQVHKEAAADGRPARQVSCPARLGRRAPQVLGETGRRATRPTAAVKVVAVIPTTPGSPFCPAGTTGVVLPYPGVRYPHILCLESPSPVQLTRPRGTSRRRLLALRPTADVAQLVEHHLAKVRVAGSNPVVRSKRP